MPWWSQIVRDWCVLSLQSTIEKEGSKGNQGAEKDEATPPETELATKESHEQIPAQGKKQEAMQRPDDPNRQRHVRQVLQWHRDTEKDEVGYTIQNGRETEPIDERMPQVECHDESRVAYFTHSFATCNQPVKALTQKRLHLFAQTIAQSSSR